MSELERKIADRIRSEGPMPFAVFMEMALYDEVHGYYRGDPFGKQGDFYTASQLQPVFGAYVATLAAQALPGYERFVDIGGGRGELKSSFTSGVYECVEQGMKIPKTNRSVLFSNELIDAMPVDLVVMELDEEGVSKGEMVLRVGLDGERLVWHPHAPKEGVVEVRAGVSDHMREAYNSIEEGCYILIDYGYRSRERVRFPAGSLMSYRKHMASEDVLRDAGQRDITAHVDWDALMSDAVGAGWVVRSFERLRASVMSLGPDVLEGLNLLGEMQLRTLLFGLGESFDVLVLDKK